MKTINEITKKELAIFKRIDKDCLNMHVMPPSKTFFKIETFEDGKKTLVYDGISKTWVRNNYNFMVSQQMGLNTDTLGTAYEAGSIAIKNIAGVVVAGSSHTFYVPTYGAGWGFRGAAGSTNSGIVVGTGSGAESFEGYALGTLIVNGSGSGQMDYAAQDALTATWSSGTKKFTQTIERFINNNSGGSITVNEIGLHLAGVIGYYMMSRDLLASPVTVGNTVQLKVTYTIETTYPE